MKYSFYIQGDLNQWMIHNRKMCHTIIETLLLCKPHFKLGNELLGELTDKVMQIIEKETQPEDEPLRGNTQEKKLHAIFRILSKEINQCSDLV